LNDDNGIIVLYGKIGILRTFLQIICILKKTAVHKNRT